MLQDIRNNFQGTFAKVIIAIICVPFVLFGVESLFSAGSSGNKVAEVNGEAITAQQLNEAMFLRKRQLIAQMGNNIDSSLLEDEQLQKPALQSLVQRELTVQAAKKSGLAISDAQLNQAIRDMPDFQIDGKFSQERFQSLLNASGLSGSIFKRLYSTDLLLSQYSSAIVGSGFITDAEVDVNARFTHETRDIRSISLSAEKFRKAVSVSDDEVKAYYEQHPEAFQSEDSVVVDYIELKMADFEQAVTDTELKTAYDNEVANFNARSSRIVSHILIDNNDKAAAAEKVALIQQKLAAGESFASLAQQYSTDLGSKEQGGLLGQLDEEAFPESFVAAANTLEEKQVSTAVATDAGLHLIELTRVDKTQAASFAERKAGLSAELKQAKAEPAYWSAVEQLKDISFNASNLNEPAAIVGSKVQSSVEFTRSNPQGIFANPDVLAQVFSKTLTEEGLNSELIELSPGHAVVLHVQRFTAAHLLAFADVAADAKSLLIDENAQKAMLARASDIESQLQQGADIEKLAKANGLTWQLELAAKRSSTKTPREVLEQAFLLPAAALDKRAIAQLELANGDYAVIAVNNVQVGNAAAIEGYERQAVKGFLARARAAASLNAIQQAFKDKADIEYYR